MIHAEKHALPFPFVSFSIELQYTAQYLFNLICLCFMYFITIVSDIILLTHSTMHASYLMYFITIVSDKI